MNLTFIQYVTIRGMWYLNTSMADYIFPPVFGITQQQLNTLVSPMTSYGATSDQFPDVYLPEFEYYYAYAFLESRHSETVGYNIRQETIQVEFDLLGEHFHKMAHLQTIEDKTQLFNELKAHCFNDIPQFN